MIDYDAIIEAEPVTSTRISDQVADMSDVEVLQFLIDEEVQLNPKERQALDSVVFDILMNEED